MSQLLSLLATPGVDLTLRHLAGAPDSAYPRIQLEDVLHGHGAPAPHSLIDCLIGENLLQWIGNRIAISRNGRKVNLLMEAIAGGDVRDIFRRLQRIDGGQSYELVREGMTESFFESLSRTSDRLGTLYVCSPWINASRHAIEHLHYACLRQSGYAVQQPELLVVTRPPRDQGNPSPLAPFRDLGARIFFHRKLHSKLYIREPDQSGGTLFAVVGSQNLTRSRYLELGIRIAGDDQLVRQLIRYFLELMNVSDEDTNARKDT